MSDVQPPRGSDPEPFVSTSVVDEAGRFVVYLDVVFADGAVRHRIGEYHSRAKADVAARFVRAAAERDHSGFRSLG